MPGGSIIGQKKASYAWDYSYGPQRPHAPTRLGARSFSYDANGNQTGWVTDKNGTRRTLVWDEENRIRSLSDNGRTHRYVYNDVGERVIKRGMQGETAYVNPYYTVRNRTIATKHVFAGTSRVASKLSPGTANIDPEGARQTGVDNRSESGNRNARNTEKNPHWTGRFEDFNARWAERRAEVANQRAMNALRGPQLGSGAPAAALPESNFLYFYRPDHLGSSSYVTDHQGALYEHRQYFPFGETWVDQRSERHRTPYLFTGKELDEETGLYYFGARY